MSANTSRMSLLAEQVGERLKSLNYRLATAESCTGGGVAYVITAVPGSSDWFERGFVVYSNEAKIDLLQVQKTTLQDFGAVSEEVAREMSAGALQNSNADISLAVTGIAGPAGGSIEKPVGTVFFSWQRTDSDCTSRRYQLHGDRESVRQQSIVIALEGILALLNTGR